MKENKEKEQRHYIVNRIDYNRIEKQYVDETIYNEFTKFIDNHRKRMQRAGTCLCLKENLWQCDSNCTDCPYSRKDVDIDAPAFNGEEGSSDESLSDYVADEHSGDYADQLVLKRTIESIIDELKEKDEDLWLIISTLYDEIKQGTYEGLNSLCKKMPMPTSTFYNRIKRLQNIFKDAGIKNFLT